MMKFVYVAICAMFLILFTGCNPRLDERAPRYDAKVCPLCSAHTGECGYCAASKKCSYCDGKGKRTTTNKGYPSKSTTPASYEEDCPHCKASGVCSHCEGTGKCWGCDGTGKVDSWNFYEKYQKREKK